MACLTFLERLDLGVAEKEGAADRRPCFEVMK